MNRLQRIAAFLLLGTAACGAPEVELILEGGTVYDGSGNAPYVADVAVQKGRIHAIGDLGETTARRRIDVAGQAVAPGFVDLHSHADLIVLADSRTQQRLLQAKIAQGVTTAFVGNCGLGVAPSNDAAAAILSDVNSWMTPDGVEAGALSVGSFLDRLESQGVALNVGTLVPHGPVRISAMGLAAGAPTEDQMTAMLGAVERGLTDGAFGLSTGLIYPPGMFSATDELVGLAVLVAQYDGLFTSHIRGSSNTLIRATLELIEVTRRSGVRSHHSHLEAVGEPFWQGIQDILYMEDEARAQGLHITHDVFPYTRAATMMSAIFPPWALEGGIDALLARLEDDTTRSRMRREIETHVPLWPPWEAGGWPHNLVGAVGWDGIIVASIGSGDAGSMIGKSLAEIGRTQGRHPFDVVADLMIAQHGQVGQLVDEISGRGDDRSYLQSILTHPAAAIVSDAEDYGRGVPHPAHAGAFARVLRMAREESSITLEEAIRRMTSYPASIVGLTDRGRIDPGAHADLVVFDTEKVGDRATWDAPRLTADGVLHVIVNGTQVVRDGGFVGGLAGTVLRRKIE